LLHDIGKKGREREPQADAYEFEKDEESQEGQKGKGKRGRGMFFSHRALGKKEKGETFHSPPYSTGI